MGLTLIHGPDSCGKTCLSLSVLDELRGATGAFVDVENKGDPKFIGEVVRDEIAFVQPYSGEAAIEAAYSLLAMGAKVVCVDTIDALLPLAEVNLDVGTREPYAQKRLVYHGASVLRDKAIKLGACVILVSQNRVNPNMRSPKPKSPFLNLIRGLTSCVLRLKRAETMAEFGKVKFTKVSIHVERLLGHPPLGKSTAYLWSERGFDRNYELFRKLEDAEVIVRRGSYWKAEGVTLGPGRETATEQIFANYEHFRSMVDG